MIDSFVSSDFTTVTKRLFENISAQKEEEKKLFNNEFSNDFNNDDNF